jgi:DNA primase
MYLVSEFAKDYFHKTLLKSEEKGLSYFKEFTTETIEKFSLGYSQILAFTKEALGKGIN